MRDKYRATLQKLKANERSNPPKALTQLLNSLQVGDSKKSHTPENDFKYSIASEQITQADESNRLGMEDTRRALARLVLAGEISNEVIKLIYFEDQFLPIEGTLLDYKRDIPLEKSAQLKTIKHIQSFHNTYGGYLIFGADEVQKDSEIIPAYESLPKFDFKILRDLCRDYLTSPIEIQAQNHKIRRFGKDYEIAILHIPARTQKIPVLVRKDAFDSNSKNILKRDEANLRDGDNSLAANNFYHWRMLFGDIENPYLKDQAAASSRRRPIYNDLPDRDFICPDFIGRQSYLSKLFTWLTDDFSCVRVLAGEGGLGKTSIAFQFASEVSRANLIDAEAVIWLTAKRYQFRAITNEYEELVNSHFSSSRELFEALARNFGEVRDNWKDLEDCDFPRLLRELGKHIKVFFIIDDLDSLDIDEQKRCIEVCQQLAGLGSRFLFTTRKNATASTSTAIEVDGLDEQEYVKLVNSWQNRLKLKELTEKDVRRLHETTHGSPLYTESLLRLVKNGMPVGEAIAKWKGNLGIDVRNAALKREVTQLGQEARKVLVTTAILGECSLAEIKIATDYSDQTLLDATNELQSLFLLHAPAIATQPRFSVSKTTKDLVIGLGTELIAEFNAYQEKIRNKRLKANGKSDVINAVGIAVNQAMALIAAGNYTDALKTVDEVHLKLKGKNKDLWFLRGRVLLKFEKPRLTEAKAAFMSAFDLGQRKPLFFELWHNTLVDLEQFEAAVEVATSAISASSGNKADWLVKRAHTRLQSASLQDKRGDTEHTVNQLDQAAEDFSVAASTDQSLIWNSNWQEGFYRTNDALWSLWSRSAQSVPEWIKAFDTQEKSIKRGDLRLESYVRMREAYFKLQRLLQGQSSSSRTENLLAQIKRRGKEILKDSPKEYRTYKQYIQLNAVFD